VTDDGQTLKGALYSNSGSTRDSFTIKKTQDPVPEPIEKDFSLTVNLIINLGPSDSWDDTTVQVPSAIQVGNQIWVYYSGNDGSAFRVGRAVANLS
jgi:hypothetical protein